MRYYYDLRFFLALSLICCLSQLMSGQQSHFVKIYTDSIPLIGSHITETPGGFEIRQEPAFFSTSYYFQQLNVDAAGDSLTAQVTGFAADSIFDPVFALPDGSFARSAKNSHRLQRLAADGSLMWDTTYVIPDYPIIANSIWNPVKMIAMAGNGDLLVGFRADTAGDYCVMRINPSQEIVWVNKIWNFGPSSGNISIDDRFYHFAPSPDGAVYLTLNTSTGAIFTIFKISAAGQIEWTKHFQLTPPMIKAADDGGLWASTIETDGDFRLTRYGPDGSVLFNKTTNEIVILPPPYNGSVNALLEMPDSTIVVAGHSHDNMDVFFMRMDLQGNIRWFWKGVLFANTPMRIRDGIATADGGFAWTGEFAGYRTLLIKTDSIGRPVTNNVSGHIRWDQNLDCIADVLENPLANWIVQLKKQSAVVTYAYTDTAGHYELPLTDFGNYTVTAIPPSFIWDVCVDEYTFSVPQNTDNLSVVQDFSAQNGYDCPIMSVDFSMPFMRRCFNSPVSLLCRNDGVTDAVDAMLEVILPPHLLLQSASLPYTLSGDTLRIHFNTFEALSYQYISLVVVPDCDSTELGQSLCISAHILPDSICAPIPGWSGALISVSAACEQDSVHFQIHNVGTAQSQTLDYIVIDDHVMSLMDNFTLAAGDTKHVSVAATGGTLRLQADQEPNAPGPTMPSVAVEGCGVDGLGNSSTGFVVQWPNQNGAPATATKCYEIVGSFDPNDKNAIPQGVTDEHFIAPNTPIDYTIRFQNT